MQFALKVNILRLRKLPHQEAEAVAGSVDPRRHVVLAFGGGLDELEVGFFAFEFLQESVSFYFGLSDHVQDVLVCSGGCSWMEALGEVRCQSGEVVFQEVFCLEC